MTKATLGATGGALTAAATTVPVQWTSGGDPVAVGDAILIDSEQMHVTAITAITATSAALTVTRAYNSTTAATHNNNAAVNKYAAPSTVSATMAPGTYIMAGGGLRVCGASIFSAPNVLIYNTQDPSNTSGDGAFDQLELNTTGSVNIGPQATGAYEGLTYWQDPNLALDTADDCNHKNNHQQSSQAQINDDIALESTASTGANGTLGSISGSIYAPANRADFVDELSGTANLAVSPPASSSTEATPPSPSTNRPLRNERGPGTNKRPAKQPNPPVGVTFTPSRGADSAGTADD